MTPQGRLTASTHILTMSLESLTADQVLYAMDVLGLKSCLEQFRSAELNGSQLAFVKTVQDLQDCELTLPAKEARTLLRFIERTNKIGVEQKYLKEPIKESVTVTVSIFQKGNPSVPGSSTSAKYSLEQGTNVNTVDSPATVPLESLTVDEVLYAMEVLGLKSCLEQFRSAELNGSQLAFVKTMQDLQDCELTLPTACARTLLRFIERANQTGVEPKYLQILASDQADDSVLSPSLRSPSSPSSGAHDSYPSYSPTAISIPLISLSADQVRRVIIVLGLKNYQDQFASLTGSHLASFESVDDIRDCGVTLPAQAAGTLLRFVERANKIGVERRYLGGSNSTPRTNVPLSRSKQEEYASSLHSGSFAKEQGPGFQHAASDSPAAIPLESLTVDEVLYAMEVLGLKSCLEQFRSAGLNGSQLAFVKTMQDLQDCELTLPIPCARTLLRFIERANQTGVEPKYLGSTLL